MKQELLRIYLKSTAEIIGCIRQQDYCSNLLEWLSRIVDHSYRKTKTTTIRDVWNEMQILEFRRVRKYLDWPVARPFRFVNRQQTKILYKKEMIDELL